MTEEAPDQLCEHNEMARIYEVLELYDDMLEQVKAVANLRKEAGEPLTLDEYHRLSIAYKHTTGRLRSAYRATLEILPSARTQLISTLVQRVQDRLKRELLAQCQEIIDLLESQVVSSNEAGVFLLKIRGDYSRYQAEVDPDNEEYRRRASQAYNEAAAIAKDLLPPTNAVRLGLALNQSVFVYEIDGDRLGACELAQDALKQALEALSEIETEKHPEVTLILQLLRDNLTLWTLESNQES